MRGLVQELRRNPDVAAIAVLALVLGLTSRTVARVFPAGAPAQARLHQIWSAPDRTAFDLIRERLDCLPAHRQEPPDCFPALDF